MRIIWQNEHYPDIVKGGGGARNTRHITEQFERAGHPTRILARKTDECQASVQKIHGIEVTYYEGTNVPPSLWLFQSTWDRFFFHKGVSIALADADAYFCIDPEFVFAMKRLYPERPVICRVEGTPAGDRASWRTRPETSLRRRFSRRWVNSILLQYQNDRLNRAAWHRADALICKSELIRNELIIEYGVSPGNISLIPNGVDFTHYSEAKPISDLIEQRAARGNGNVVVTFVGRLSRVKNLDLALRALACMPERSNVTFLVVGDGEERRTLEQIAVDLGISALVRFVGHQQDVAPYLKATDIFILPSLYETVANCLLEAMAAGCACIALRPDGRRIRTASDVVIQSERTGILVDGTSPQSFSLALSRLKSDVPLRKRLSRAGQDLVSRNFDWQSCAAQYLRVADRLLNRTMAE